MIARLTLIPALLLASLAALGGVYGKGDRVRLTPLGVEQYPGLNPAGYVGSEPDESQQTVSYRVGTAAGVPVLVMYIEPDQGPRPPLTPRESAELLATYTDRCSLFRGLTIEQRTSRLLSGMPGEDITEIAILAASRANADVRGRITEAAKVLRDRKPATSQQVPRVITDHQQG